MTTQEQPAAKTAAPAKTSFSRKMQAMAAKMGLAITPEMEAANRRRIASNQQILRDE